MALFDEIKSSIIDMDDVLSAELARKALDEGISPMEIVDNALIAGIDVVGEKFKNFE